MKTTAEFYASALQLPDTEKTIVDNLEARMRGWIEAGELVIPSIPTVIGEAMRLSSDPKATVDEIEKLVEKDQAISGRLIQISNSPLLRGVREVQTIRESITRIGQQELRMTLFGMFVQSRLFKSKIYGELMEQLWKHSLAAGSIARLLAEQTGQDPDVAFLAGFLHDIGMPVLLGTLTEKQAGRDIMSPRLIELAMQRVHEDAGAAICREYNMPQAVMDAVTCHHRFLKAKENLELAAIVQIASALTYRFGLGFSPKWLAAYVADSHEYLPLSDSYRAALALEIEEYPPFEMFEQGSQPLLELVEANTPRLRAELDNPFVSASKTRVIKPNADVTLKDPISASLPQSGPSGGSGWMVGAGIAAATLAGLAIWWLTR